MAKKLEIKEADSKRDWEKFVSNYPPLSFLQSWNWGETNELMGDKVFRLGLYEKDKLAGVCLVIKAKAKRGAHFLIPGGPLINFKKRSHFQAIFDYLVELGRKERVWFIRVRPQLLASPGNLKIFKNLGFIPAPIHLHAETTWELDINKPEEEILMGMRKTTRNLVRRSERSGLVCRESKDPKDAKILFKLQQETVKRHGFVGFSKKAFASELKTFGYDDQASLFLVRYQRKILAAAIFIFYGEIAYYHYSGSSSDFPKIPSTHFLLWQAIKEAKKRGCRVFNFWGIAPTEDSSHPWAGLTLFKKGFGGERVDYLHAQDYPLKNYYRLTRGFETIRRIRRKL
jgi:lipid II:glycine glycyltransferase (peptidoglycan interpeptide bridge formation enzyme)